MEMLATAIALLFAFISLFIAYHGIKYMMDCHRMLRAGLWANGTVTLLKQVERTRSLRRGLKMAKDAGIPLAGTGARVQRNRCSSDPFAPVHPRL
ncbi:MAG: hypothetical protein RIR11_3827 [Bacteroidota bacterium]